MAGWRLVDQWPIRTANKGVIKKRCALPEPVQVARQLWREAVVWRAEFGQALTTEVGEQVDKYRHGRHGRHRFPGFELDCFGLSAKATKKDKKWQKQLLVLEICYDRMSTLIQLSYLSHNLISKLTFSRHVSNKRMILRNHAVNLISLSQVS